MRQQIVTKTGTGSSPVIATDTYISPFNVGFGVVVTGTGTYSVTYSVQHTFDNPQTNPNPTFFSHPTVASITATNAAPNNADGNYAFPVAAIKVIVTAQTGTATATMTLIQAGIA